MRIGWRNPWESDKAVEITAVARTHGMHGASETLAGGIALTLAALGDGLATRST
ncbi:hypothetical protein [Breoghania sp.]|uniref:hypothetical protein n=1 Tax=Breoghania sp. TaxID=2065378 RepID=UPI00262DE421|nr:hypothetical protein [Breoghania sp.]MDJ0930040.1 hypothetical protein [Breoghania sp.]